MRHSRLTFIWALALALCPPLGMAERSWSDGVLDNLRATIDVSSRPLYYVDEDRSAFMHAVGIDVHKVFSSETRDIGTLTAQAYLTRIDDARGYPGFFDDDDDTQLVYRIFNFNFTGLGEYVPNVKIGHLEVAYGLEQKLDTNGTLRQYAQPQNLGIKADWGISLNKEHRRFEYEVTATTGGGQSLDRQDGSYVYAARIGTSRDANFSVGTSAYKSLLAGVDRDRFGVDVQYFFGRSNINGEFSIGSNNNRDVRNGLLEYNRTNRSESLQIYTQLIYLSSDQANGWARTVNASLGISYRPDTHIDISAQYTRTMRNPVDSHPSTLSLQFRYRV